jgi:transposase InsO family protein
MCRTLDISTAGYYAWRDRPTSARRQRQDALATQIRSIHGEMKERYGSPRVHAELQARGHGCCVNTVARLMREAGIAAKTTKKFRCTTDSDHGLPVANNVLDRQFAPEAPNEAWVCDITYVPTREGWLYLAAVVDLYSRAVVGWAMEARMTSRLVVEALGMAVARRLPGSELVAHSDRGSQYASEHYQRLLGERGITCSMSRRANCWDNAPNRNVVQLVKGDTQNRDRYFLGFNTPYRPEILVSTSVGQEGIDLHRECRHVIHHDLCWNPATIEQRTGRVDRIGSKVERERMGAEDGYGPTLEIAVPYLAATYDERMFEELYRRAQLFEVTLGGDLRVEGRIDPEQVASEHRRREKLGIGTDDEDIGDDAEETGVVDLPADMVERLRVDLAVWKAPCVTG